jgi:hypothetical protein
MPKGCARRIARCIRILIAARFSHDAAQLGRWYWPSLIYIGGSVLPATLQFLITMLASSLNERMQRKLDYTQEEVRILKEHFTVVTG